MCYDFGAMSSEAAPAMLVLVRALVLAPTSGASEIGIDHLLAALDAESGSVNTLLLRWRERSSPFQGRKWRYHLARLRRLRHLKTFRLFLWMFCGASFFPQSVAVRIERVRAVARGHLPSVGLTPPVENVVREGVGGEPRDPNDTRNSSRERTGQTSWPDDRHLRNDHHQPDQVHRYNQRAHGTGESVGSFAVTGSVEPLHEKE